MASLVLTIHLQYFFNISLFNEIRLKISDHDNNLDANRLLPNESIGRQLSATGGCTDRQVNES